MRADAFIGWNAGQVRADTSILSRPLTETRHAPLSIQPTSHRTAALKFGVRFERTERSWDGHSGKRDGIALWRGQSRCQAFSRFQVTAPVSRSRASIRPAPMAGALLLRRQNGLFGTAGHSGRSFFIRSLYRLTPFPLVFLCGRWQLKPGELARCSRALDLDQGRAPQPGINSHPTASVAPEHSHVGRHRAGDRLCLFRRVDRLRLCLRSALRTKPCSSSTIRSPGS
jgi:hypothetical protein